MYAASWHLRSPDIMIFICGVSYNHFLCWRMFAGNKKTFIGSLTDKSPKVWELVNVQAMKPWLFYTADINYECLQYKTVLGDPTYKNTKKWGWVSVKALEPVIISFWKDSLLMSAA